MRIDDPAGLDHFRPRLPRPPVCSSARITRPSLLTLAAARAARSFVLVTRFQTAMRRPITRIPSSHSIWSGHSLGEGPR